MPQRVVVVFSAHWVFSIFELNIPFNSHDTTFASWHIFKCHNSWLFENSHITTFRVMVVSLMPQRVVVFFPPSARFRSLSVTLIQFVYPDDEHDVLETCRVINKNKYIERNLCVTLVIYQGSLHDGRSTKCRICPIMQQIWFF